MLVNLHRAGPGGRKKKEDFDGPLPARALLHTGSSPKPFFGCCDRCVMDSHRQSILAVAWWFFSRTLYFLVFQIVLNLCVHLYEVWHTPQFVFLHHVRSICDRKTEDTRGGHRRGRQNFSPVTSRQLHFSSKTRQNKKNQKETTMDSHSSILVVIPK